MLPTYLPWLLILPLVFPSQSHAALSTFNDDVLALIVFKSSLQDPHSALSSWTDSDDSPCRWPFITCDPASNRVTSLSLDSLSLSGQLSRALLRLTSLQSLSLSHNNLSGPIPDFSTLYALHTINLHHNSLSGSIPDQLFQQCGSLKHVSFSSNFLSGELPGSFGSCMSLVSVDFSSNRISGTLSESVWSLSGLETLDLSSNELEGVVGEGIGRMYSLRAVSFARNAFSGGLPGDLGECPHLEVIDFSENSISGGMPRSMRQLGNCSTIALSGNLLDGEVPDWIGQLESLENLDLSRNKFSGRIPDSLGNLGGSLRVLNLSSNGFIGDVPESLKACSRLVSIDVSRNSLAGDLPGWVFGMGLRSVSLSGNGFSGSVQLPSAEIVVNSYDKLEVLDLSSNELSGVIPTEIAAFRNLLVLNLSCNSLFGAVPTTVGGLKMVRVVDLSNNSLNGSIPVEIGGAVSMRELRLQNNLLNGHVPNQIGNCSSMTTLILKENNLTGPIPATIANLKDLQVADLSKNNLTGSIPKELTNLSQLRSFNISYNHLEGELPDSSFFNTIPLSSVSGNPLLCGSVVNQACPAVHPKPIVLNPNSSSDTADGSVPPNLRKKKLMLSISSLVAISAAAFIFLGVVAITILNFRARSSSFRLPAAITFSIKDDFSQSPASDSEYGKLVMFSGDADFGEGAHALLSKERETGRGGFGTVYHTVLGNGRSFAIKKLSISSLIKSQGEYEREVTKLGKAKHHNLVGLEGYYWTPSLHLLINEYVPNGSLFNRLHDDPTTSCALSWHQRFNIIKGIAKGLAHLHKMSIIHYNIKSTNILLDSCNEPKVGDFGLAKLLPMMDRFILSSKIQSALGYMAPEFACRTVKITEKCDVYGFGVLVLEIVTGRKPVEYMEDDVVVLCDMVREALDEGSAQDCVDKRLSGNEVQAEEVIPVIKLGLVCASQVPSSRPDMAEVVNILELIGCHGGEREDLE